MRCLVALMVVVWVCCAGAGFAQGQGGKYLARVWRSEDGLPGNVVRSVGQTPDGMLWVITAEGLCRFDGYEFENVGASEEESGSVADLFRVFTTESGAVWVSTFRGGLFRLENGVLQRVAVDRERMGSGIVTAVLEAHGETFFYYNDAWWQVAGDQVGAKAELGPGFDPLAEKCWQREAAQGRSENHTQAVQQVADGAGGVWTFGTQGVAHRDAEGRVETLTHSELAGSVVVADALVDREGNLWLASPTRGLVRIRPRRVIYLSEEERPYSYALNTGITSQDGGWWLARRSGGLDRLREDGTVEHLPLLSQGVSRTVSSLLEDKRGDLWIATRDGSVQWLARGEANPRARFGRVGEMSKVVSVVADASGAVWFAGRHGICKWAGKELEVIVSTEEMAGREFSVLASGVDGEMWVGTMDGRVYLLERGKLRQVGDGGALGGSIVSAILPLEDGETWAATIGNGLFQWKSGIWQRIGSSAGLPDERLTSLTLVDGETFWAGSLGGIIRVPREDLLRAVVDPSFAPRWLRLDRSDGMVTRECVGGSQPGVSGDASGRLWFPTAAGMAGVAPERLRLENRPPALRLRGVEVDGQAQEIMPGEEIVAGPGRARLGFRFAGLSLSAPEKVRYRVRLVGIGEDWHSVDSERRVDYQAVPPGEYVFEVLSTNGDGVSNPQPLRVAVVVRPHFWQTRWFIVAAVATGLLAALGVGWLVARHRMKERFRQLQMKGLLEAERSRISRDLHDDLGASLTALTMLTELTAEENHDEALRPSLKNLSFETRRVVAALDEIVWATSPRHDSLRSMVEYLAFSVREFLKAVHVPLAVEIGKDIPDVALGPKRRHNMFLATREAVNNAVKHAEATGITLKITVENGHLVVRVKDDGVGYQAPQDSLSEGLGNLRMRMQESGGNCEIQSVQGEGTTVILSLPITN